VPSQASGNVFDHLPVLAAPKPTDLLDELDRYLMTDPEPTDNVLGWWTKHCSTFLCLSRMAFEYPRCVHDSLHTIHTLIYFQPHLSTSREFSCGRLVLSHVRSCMTAQTTRAILCLGNWSRLGLVKSDDVRAAAALLDVEGMDSDYEMEEGWDQITDSLEYCSHNFPLPCPPYCYHVLNKSLCFCCDLPCNLGG
jgi:hypothetical protein